MITYTDITNRNNLHSDNIRYQYVASIMKDDPQRALFITLQTIATLGRGSRDQRLFPLWDKLLKDNMGKLVEILPEAKKLKDRKITADGSLICSGDDFSDWTKACEVAEELLFNNCKNTDEGGRNFSPEELAKRNPSANFNRWVPAEVKGFKPYFVRGFVEYITLDTRYFLNNFQNIYQAAPIRHVQLTNYKGHFSELAASESLQGIVYLEFKGWNLSDEYKMDDYDLAMLAASEYVKDLKLLSMPRNRITDKGLVSLATSKKFPSLQHVRFISNCTSEDATHGAYGDWIGPEDYELTTLGEKLRKINPHAIWLHPTSGERPLMEDL